MCPVSFSVVVVVVVVVVDEFVFCPAKDEAETKESCASRASETITLEQRTRVLFMFRASYRVSVVAN
jgi:hypothetical protein